MSTLIEMAGDIGRALEELTEESGFDAQTIADTMDGLYGSFEDKAIRVAYYIRSLEADAEEIKAEEQRLKRRRDAINKRAESLKTYLLISLHTAGQREVKTPLLSVTVAKNPPSVVVDDVSLLTWSLLRRVPEIIEPDKAAIKAALKEGDVPGAHLEPGKERIAIR